MKKIFSAFAVLALMLFIPAQANSKPTPKTKVAKSKASKSKKPVKKPTPNSTDHAAPVLDENGKPVRTMQDELLAE